MHEKNPNAVIVGTEQDPYSVPGSNVPTWYAVRNTPYVVGHHLWTGWTTWARASGPWEGRAASSITASSASPGSIISKASGASRPWSISPSQRHGNGRAMPALAENWNQTGPVDVVTFTNCESIDLYVNDTKIGTQKSSDFAKTGVMQWTKVPWQAGVIKAVGRNGGKEVSRTASRPWCARETSAQARSDHPRCRWKRCILHRSRCL